MQVNDLVKVIKEKSKHAGRAGIVNAATAEGMNTIRLDATEKDEAVTVELADADLQFLGR